MNTFEFEEYLKKIRQSAILYTKGEASLDDLIMEIQQYTSADPGFQDFFQAEIAFYSHQYEKALQFYLKAKAIPYFPGFCFRASAAISKEKNDLPRAIQFAQKALVVLPDDFPSLNLLATFLSQAHSEDAPKVNRQLEELEYRSTHENHSVAFEPPSKVNLANEELDELASLFQENIVLVNSSNNSYTTENSLLPKAKNYVEPSTYVENTMTVDTAFFSSRKNDGSDELTARLYDASENEKSTAYAPTSPYTIDLPETQTTNLLEKQIELFQGVQRGVITKYLDKYHSRKVIKDHFFCLFAGWNHAVENENSIFQVNDSEIPQLLLSEKARQSSRGFYIRWNNQGIVINPGKSFLNKFHKQGLHIKDIDYVIVTQSSPEAHHDIKAMYDLNYQLNKSSSEMHIIHYYLNQKAYQELSRTLKPNFKQERNTIHCLEIFQDSPDVEKIDLGDGITLNYFLTYSQESFLRALSEKDSHAAPSTTSLGLRFDLRTSSQTQGRTTTRLGYVTGTSWSPLLAHHLGNCDVLVAGFGHTCSNDYQKISHNEDNLGFYGSYSLMEEIQPRLFLSTEFSGKEGDLRIEITKKMREDFAKYHSSARTQPVILPGDNGLYLDLKALQIQCTVSHAMIDIAHVRVAKSADSFGQLHYLAPSCIL